MRRVRVYRHEPSEHLGRIEPVLAARGIAVAHSDLYAGEHASGPADGLIFLGGPMSANDSLPWLREEMDTIRDAVHAQIPILGICLGAQLIAKALGARVFRNPAPEVGWFPVCLTGEGAADPLLGGFEREETVFHWHEETFDLPEGAVWLAYSAACPNQAFRHGDRVYGLQFHLEVTPEMVAGWRPELDPGCNAARLGQLTEEVFGRWCELA